MYFHVLKNVRFEEREIFRPLKKLTPFSLGGLLTAAISGETFASPTIDAVLAAIVTWYDMRMYRGRFHHPDLTRNHGEIDGEGYKFHCQYAPKKHKCWNGKTLATLRIFTTRLGQDYVLYASICIVNVCTKCFIIFLGMTAYKWDLSLAFLVVN